MSQFSTNEHISLEKTINLQQPLVVNNLENLEEIYEIDRCLQWIRTNNYQKVCLQFPDHLLPDSVEIALIFERNLQRPVYILGDTNYGSCCIDYVGAAHINADAIIHYGPVCFSKTTAAIPFLNIYEKHQIDLEAFSRLLLGKFNGKLPEILLDTDYIHHRKNIAIRFPEIVIKTIDCDCKFDGNSVIFIGNNERKLLNLKFFHQGIDFYFYNPKNCESLENYQINEKQLKRHYYLIEKIKDSQTFGIIIGTLSVCNYLEIIKRIKQLLEKKKRKYYLISVGKPTIAKLANFPEIDIYVMIACSLNEIYENRDFYKPIVAPYDIEIAFNSPQIPTNFNYDFSHLLSLPINDQLNDDHTISLITGRLRHVDDDHDGNKDENMELMEKNDGRLVLNTNYGSGYLNQQRTWQGLQPNLGNNEPVLAQDGRYGTAQSYQHENTS